MSPSPHRRQGLVRSYTATGGRVVPSRSSLDEATLLRADPKVERAGLGAQARRVMDLCLPGVVSIAEVAARLGLPVAVTKVIVSDLVDSKHLMSRSPYVPAADGADEEFLERVLDALHKL
ncbi:DUF742 domain-containing protein [Streptomyces niveus]|uniref:DUF742 domain-containing protein n=1 Tax=Streptomyces niveus TaxID=193462 RepID=UPI0036BC541A